MMQLTLGRHRFTLSGNDALFVAEAILLQRKHPDIVLPDHRSDKHGVIRLTNRLTEMSQFHVDDVIDHNAID
ncbi:hypothetical protein JZM41_22585 [Serratia marcescens]|nr:hypothetical protein [Serratia marcescens]MBN6138828.1 hypothetical protein [Serratia marcescens]QIO26162.1 hypothetical protein HAP49_03115 [Serratia marcescens]